MIWKPMLRASAVIVAVLPAPEGPVSANIRFRRGQNLDTKQEY